MTPESSSAPGTAEIRTGRSIIQIAWGSQTHTGKVRRVNEDSLLVAPPVYVVADGMGGHDGGDVASALAVGTMASLQNRAALDRAAILDTIRSANRMIYQRSGGRSRGMGTTLTGLVVTSIQPGHEMVSLNIGDSRTYRYRNGVLTQLTVDHSHVQELVDAGLLDPADAADHAERNVVTRALGIEVEVEVDLQPVATNVGDRFLVCSDGVTGELANDQIVAALGDPNPVSAASALLALVLQGRAADNASMIVLDVLGIEDDPDTERTNPRGDVLAKGGELVDTPTDPRRARTEPSLRRTKSRNDELQFASMDLVRPGMIVDVPHAPNPDSALSTDSDSAAQDTPPVIDGIPTLDAETPATMVYFDATNTPLAPIEMVADPDPLDTKEEVDE